MKVNISNLRTRFQSRRVRRISLIALLILPVFSMLVYLGGVYAFKSLPAVRIYQMEYKRNKENPERALMYLRLLKSTIDSKEVNKKQYLNLISLLTSHTSKYSSDPYNAFYYAMVADSYLSVGSHSQAVYYYLKSISVPSVFAYNSSQRRILEELSTYDNVTRRNIVYLNELRRNYLAKIDILQTEYNLGSLYDSFGDWESAYAAYGRYLHEYFFGNPTSLTSESVKHAEDVFFRYHRSYLRPSLTFAKAQDAKNALAQAIRVSRRSTIKAMRAPKFFTVQWNESPIDSNAQIPNFDIIRVLRDSHFNASPRLVPSAVDEVLWETYGWLRVGTWNMVFREINQPDTIALNGRWEWAGIYFGTGNNLYAPQ